MKLLYQGRDITADVKLLSCVHDHREMGRLPELRAEFSDADGRWGGWAPAPGDAIEVRDAGAPPTGEMTVASVEPSSGAMALVATPLAGPCGSASRAFEGASFRAVASRLARDMGLSPRFHGASGPEFARFEQRGETHLAALARLCALSGCLMDVHGGTLHLYGREWSEAQESAGTLEIDAYDRMEWHEGPAPASLALVQLPGDGRRAMEATARGGGESAETAVLPEQVAFGTSAAMREAAANVLAARAASRTWGCVAQDAPSPFTPGSVVDVECEANPLVAGRAIVTRVRNDFADGSSKTWWRPI